MVTFAALKVQHDPLHQFYHCLDFIFGWLLLHGK